MDNNKIEKYYKVLPCLTKVGASHHAAKKGELKLILAETMEIKDHFWSRPSKDFKKQDIFLMSHSESDDYMRFAKQKLSDQDKHYWLKPVSFHNPEDLEKEFLPLLQTKTFYDTSIEQSIQESESGHVFVEGVSLFQAQLNSVILRILTTADKKYIRESFDRRLKNNSLLESLTEITSNDLVIEQGANEFSREYAIPFLETGSIYS